MNKENAERLVEILTANQHTNPMNWEEPWIIVEKFLDQLSDTTEEPEFMTFEKAFKKAENGDKITDDYDNFFIKGGTKALFSVEIYIRNKWKIIPAEPVSTTIEEWITKRAQLKDGGKWYAQDARQAGEFFNKQQWLNHKELREAVAEFIKYYPNVVRMNVKRITEAAKNIKPLAAE